MRPIGPTGEPFLASDRLPPVSEVSGPEALTARPAPSEPLPESVGPYKILGRLGTGGMGVVYRAQQEQPRREVALKVIKPDTVSPEQLNRLRREAEVLGRFRHDGIARIYEAGQIGVGDEAHPYLVMELIDGRPLTTYADAERHAVPKRLRLMIEICHAVRHAHQKAVIHGDLKPANILVDDTGQPKVLDFGLARILSRTTPDGSVQVLAVEALLGVQWPGLLAAAAAHVAYHDARDRADQALLRQAMGHLHEMLTLDPHRPLQTEIAVGLAMLAGEYSLARQLLDDWEGEANADDRTKILGCRAGRSRQVLASRVQVQRS
jgi:serine/threonine protein kinase